MVVRESVNTEPGSLNIKRPRELKFHPVIPCYFRPRDSGTTKRCSRIKRESSPCSSRERERERLGIFACSFRIESNPNSLSIDSRGRVGFEISIVAPSIQRRASVVVG